MRVQARSSLPRSVTTDMLPCAAPAAWGAKLTERLVLCSGARVIGKLGPLKLNPVPETDTCEMVIFRLLVLRAEVQIVLLLPSWTPPKLRAEEVSASCPDAAFTYKTIWRRSKCQQRRLHSRSRRRISSTLLLRAHTAHGGGLWSRCQRDADRQAFQRSDACGTALPLFFAREKVDRSQEAK